MILKILSKYSHGRIGLLRDIADIEDTFEDVGSFAYMDE